MASQTWAAKAMVGDRAESEAERQKRHVEKLRWQLRNTRRAVLAKRATWQNLGAQKPPSTIDRLLVAGFVAGGALGVLGVRVLSGLLFP